MPLVCPNSGVLRNYISSTLGKSFLLQAFLMSESSWNYHHCTRKALCFFILCWLAAGQLSILTYCGGDLIASGQLSNKVGTGSALPSASEDAEMFSGGEQLKQYSDLLRVPTLVLFWLYFWKY